MFGGLDLILLLCCMEKRIKPTALYLTGMVEAIIEIECDFKSKLNRIEVSCKGTEDCIAVTIQAFMADSWNAEIKPGIFHVWDRNTVSSVVSAVKHELQMIERSVDEVWNTPVPVSVMSDPTIN